MTDFPTIHTLLTLAVLAAWLVTLLWPADTPLGRWLEGQDHDQDL